MSDSSDIEYHGVLKKRRSGWMKNMDSVWYPRYFILKKNLTIQYYDDDKPPKEGSIVRKSTTLSGSKVTFMEPFDGAPNSFTITILPAGDSEKWRMTTESKHELDNWMAAFDRLSVMMNMHDSRQNNRSMSPGPSDKSSNANSPNVKVNTSGSIVNSTSSPEASPIAENKSKNTSESNNTSSVKSGANEQPAAAAVRSSTSSKSTLIRSGSSTTSRGASLTSKASSSSSSTDSTGKQSYEALYTIIILNVCIYFAFTTDKLVMKIVYFFIINLVLGATLYIRSARTSTAEKTAQQAMLKATAALELAQSILSTNSYNAKNPADDDRTQLTAVALFDDVEGTVSNVVVDGKPIAGATFQEAKAEASASGESAYLDQMDCPQHTWSKCDYRLFNVRMEGYCTRGHPNKDKKAPSSPPLFEAFAVDIFCSSKRIDHAAERFKMPEEYLNVNTGHPHFPPVLVVQIQLPSDEPSLLGPAVEDGNGWAILMYFKITQDTLNQLKDFPKNAGPAVRLFAQYAEKAQSDPEWRKRFKVIASCLNIEDLGIPSSAASYNGKPVLIRRTGSVFRDSANRYMELDLHIHTMDRFAKTGIHAITKNCGIAFMQIGFVLEGKDDSELPETLFACVGVNCPQESKGVYLFEPPPQ